MTDMKNRMTEVGGRRTEVRGRTAAFCLLTSVLSLLSSCAIEGGRHGATRVFSARFFWRRENTAFTFQTTNITATLAVGKSGVDSDAIGNITEAAVRGAVKGAAR
jgi:hypothetical protein